MVFVQITMNLEKGHVSLILFLFEQISEVDKDQPIYVISNAYENKIAK